MRPAGLLASRNQVKMARVKLVQRSGRSMRAAMAPALVGLLLLGACSDAEDDLADPNASPTTEPSTEAMVIRTRMTIAAEAGAEPIATGEVLKRSTLGGATFCAGGTILDSHASSDPAMEPYGLIDRTITCSDGTVRIGFTPNQADALNQMGSWTIVSGTGAFEGLQGSGDMEIVYDPDDDALAHETLTGTVTR